MHATHQNWVSDRRSEAAFFYLPAPANARAYVDAKIDGGEGAQQGIENKGDAHGLREELRQPLLEPDRLDQSRDRVVRKLCKASRREHDAKTLACQETKGDHSGISRSLTLHNPQSVLALSQYR